MRSIQIEPITKADHAIVAAIMQDYWGDTFVVVHGEIFHAAEMPGLKAVSRDEIVGIMHYRIFNQECEILTLASRQEGQGIGTSLVNAVEEMAWQESCRVLSVTTTNDNLHALGFYQRRGFFITALYPDQVAFSRQIKPAIPLISDNGIPIRDEIRLEKEIPTNPGMRDNK